MISGAFKIMFDILGRGVKKTRIWKERQET